MPIASGRGHDAAIAIRQRDAVLWGGRLQPGETVTVPDARHAHVFVAAGRVVMEGAEPVELTAGDAVRLTEAGAPRLVVGRPPGRCRGAHLGDGRDGMTTILVATTAGLYRLVQWPELLHIEPILDLAGDYVLVAGYGVQKGFDFTGEYIEVPGGHLPAVDRARELFAGTQGAHLVRVGLDGQGNQPVASFDAVAGRGRWYQPHGGPPSARTTAVDDEGRMYVNVHVGRHRRASDDGGQSWEPTIDIDTDVHQVATVPGHPGHVVAATARGMAFSEDYGQTWKIIDDGLFAKYARAVAVGDDIVFLSASEGPGGTKAAVYRRALVRHPPVRQVPGRVPRVRSTGNVDSGCIAASGKFVVVGTARRPHPPVRGLRPQVADRSPPASPR